MDSPNSKVFVMLSGGVDSSVAAARLVDAGYAVTGVFMRNWSVDRLSKLVATELAHNCSSAQDEAYAKATAEFLGIPFRVVNFEQEYWDKVIEPFFAGIGRGETPNPDIWCNQFVKFGVFLDWALQNGADLVATGHYARLRRRKFENSRIDNLEELSTINSKLSIAGDISLLRGVDPSKDQSYFLAHVPVEKLKYTLFPVGHLYKSQVRAEALARNLPTATRKDSQGICFIGKIPFKEFLKERFHTRVGDVVLENGEKIGEHDGVWFYTIGERLGFRPIQSSKIKNQPARQSKLGVVGGNYNSKFKNIFGDSKVPLYIVGKDVNKNILIVGLDNGQEPLWKKEFVADNWNWFTLPSTLRYKPLGPGSNESAVQRHEKSIKNQLYDIEIRYHQTPKSKGRIFLIHNSTFLIRLEEPVRAVTRGQTVVLSKSDRIIGAGTINS